MTNLIDIPIVVTTLITFFTSGGSEAVLEAFKGITVNTALMLSDLKDELLGKPEVNTLVQQVEQNPLDINLQQQLREILTQELERHPIFQHQTAVNIEGNVTAKKGSVAAAVISGGTITNHNTFGSDDK
ncbi:MAG: hypothetical protein V3V18_11975 [Methylococcales bacterium]